MQKNQNHIKRELEDLNAIELVKLKKAELKVPLEIKNQLLNKVDFDKPKQEGQSGKLIKISLALGLAATLVLAFFLWPPAEAENKLSMETFSDDEIAWYLYDRIDEIDEEDLMPLASNEVSLFEFTTIEDAYFEEEILSNDDFDYDDLF